MKKITLGIECTDRILAFIGGNYGKVFSKTWTCEIKALAIFIHKEYVIRTSSYQTLTTIIETDPKQQKCTVTVIGSGGGGGILNIDLGSQSSGEDTLIKRVREESKRVSGFRYHKCPKCGIPHSYPDDKIHKGLLVKCFNCHEYFELPSD